MLGELDKISQPAGQPRRRWFADEEMDLVVWYDEKGRPEGFELCYDKTGAEHAFRWKRGGRLRHEAVDAGEDLPSENRTPILVPGGKAPVQRVSDDFAARSLEIPAELRELVLSALKL